MQIINQRIENLELNTYDRLECPHCGKVCFPDAIRKDGSVVYELHKCKSDYEFSYQMRDFEIDSEGNLVDKFV